MTLTRWQRATPSTWAPLYQLSTLRNEIDRLFSSPFETAGSTSQPFLSGWSPAIDLYEDHDNVIVKAELPGMKKENLELSLHEGVFSLSGERKAEPPRDDAEVYRSERVVGRFHRTITLPSPVDGSKAKATYQDGILTVTLPKAEEAKPKQIHIKD